MKKQASLRTVVDQIVATKDPARLIEICYWSAEPELAEVMRQFIALPELPKNALVAFFAMARGNADSVVVTVGPMGEVTLSSPVVSYLMQVMGGVSPKKECPEALH